MGLAILATIILMNEVGVRIKKIIQKEKHTLQYLEATHHQQQRTHHRCLDVYVSRLIHVQHD